ncbi:hypothetical protein Poli38472_010295 [Pythium oligandrum]|uniref:Uncharacterized protein n=1 Tax=Pythium oligandrum TaxID=41045 RepID=A0A8K1C987_PYTOL|nr:hypothetical protein Poli38472_010295 [Pythium oligandrum]|eukprot:TMW58736.1 hypothetical protein Poli38472_010295 [Pythium oligandrum]
MVQVAKALAPQLARFPVCVPALDAQVKAMVRAINCPGGPWDIGVMLTTNEHVHRLNRKYRRKDKPTDILSFPFHKVCRHFDGVWMQTRCAHGLINTAQVSRPGRFPVVRSREERYLGDIYISLPYVYDQYLDPEETEVTSLEQRMPILFAHGICHLLGYDHETDADYERMAKAEAFILGRYESYLDK